MVNFPAGTRSMSGGGGVEGGGSDADADAGAGADADAGAGAGAGAGAVALPDATVAGASVLPHAITIAPASATTTKTHPLYAPNSTWPRDTLYNSDRRDARVLDGAPT
jgi:hypothetical protein